MYARLLSVFLLAGLCSNYNLASAQTASDNADNTTGVKLTPSTANFDTVLVGATSAAKTFTLFNDQDATLNIASIGVGGTNPTDFKVKKTTCTSQLLANSKCTISVTITPGATGSRSGVLIVTDGTDDGTQQVQLQGIGGVLINVFGTGHVAGGAGLAKYGAIDGNFVLISCPAGEPCASNGNGDYDAFVTLTNQYPFPPWRKDTSTARWIGPANGGDEVTVDVPGLYQYQETFDLTGFDLATVVLKGSFATDNSGYIQLNGVTVGPTNSNDASLTPFSITSGFNQGTNTLDFFVTNGPTGGAQNPTGMLVELSGLGAP